MARYTGPKDKISRRFGVPLFGPTKALERKNYPPGMHGPKGSPPQAVSEYSVALAEKQKLRFQYGVLERQFRRYFENRRHRRGVTGEHPAPDAGDPPRQRRLPPRLRQLPLRRPPDRRPRPRAGERPQGRHLLLPGEARRHRHRSGTSPQSRSLAARNLELTQITPVPDWLAVDKEQFTGKVARIPTRDEIAPIVNEQLIVELYSR